MVMAEGEHQPRQRRPAPAGRRAARVRAAGDDRARQRDVAGQLPAEHELRHRRVLDPEARHRVRRHEHPWYARSPWYTRSRVAAEWHPFHRDEPLVVPRGLELPDRPQLRSRGHQPWLALRQDAQLLRLRQPAEQGQLPEHQVDLSLGQRGVEPHAAHPGAVPGGGLHHEVAGGAGQVRVVEHQPLDALAQPAVELPGEDGQGAAAVVAVEPFVPLEISGEPALARSGDAHDQQHLGAGRRQGRLGGAGGRLGGAGGRRELEGGHR